MPLTGMDRPAAGRLPGAAIALVVLLAHVFALRWTVFHEIRGGSVPSRPSAAIVHLLPAMPSTQSKRTALDATNAAPDAGRSAERRDAFLPPGHGASTDAAAASAPTQVSEVSQTKDGGSKPVAHHERSSDERFYPFEELDVPAEPTASMDALDIDVPPMASAEVLLKIDRRGIVVSAQVRRARPAAFGEAMRERLAGMRFRPALRHGRPVNSVKFIEFAASF